MMLSCKSNTSFFFIMKGYCGGGDVSGLPRNSSLHEIQKDNGEPESGHRVSCSNENTCI